MTPPGCQQCGAPFVHQLQEGALCAPCAAPDKFRGNLCGQGRLDGVRSAVIYDALAAALVLQLKYGDRHDLAAPLARLMLGAFTALGAPSGAVLCPVPLHPARLKARRFNQALLLAQAIARSGGPAVRCDLVTRVKATPQQKGLGFEGRYRNLAGAFQAHEAARGLDIILVDDVLTSGATLVGAARALRRVGARSIRAITFARVFSVGHDAQVDWPEV